MRVRIRQIILTSLNLFAVHLLKTIDLLKFKLSLICRHAAIFRISISKVQEFGNFDFHPWHQ